MPTLLAQYIDPRVDVSNYREDGQSRYKRYAHPGIIRRKNACPGEQTCLADRWNDKLQPAH